MKIKTLQSLLVLALIIGLHSCSGSDTYRGKWNATDIDGNKSELIFSENTFLVYQDGDTTTFEYTQHSVNIENSVKKYGVQLSDGKKFSIFFPIGNNESKGSILDVNEEVVYIISRNDFLEYNDIYGL
jgi:hypothetical protein